jgi:hypothetical protein
VPTGVAETVGEGVSVGGAGGVSVGVVTIVAEGGGVRVNVAGIRGVPGPGASDVAVGKIEIGVGSEGDAGAGSVQAARRIIEIRERIVRRMVVTSPPVRIGRAGVPRVQLYTLHLRQARTAAAMCGGYSPLPMKRDTASDYRSEVSVAHRLRLPWHWVE